MDATPSHAAQGRAKIRPRRENDAPAGVAELADALDSGAGQPSAELLTLPGLARITPPPGDSCRELIAAAATAPDPRPLLDAADALRRGGRDEDLARRLLALAAAAADPWPLVAAARLLLPGGHQDLR